jgi:anti-anti-sigma factor
LTFAESVLAAAAVEEALAAVASAGCRNVVLDCQAVRSLVSGSLFPQAEPFTPLLRLRRQLQKAGGRLVLCRLDPSVAEVLRITRLDRLFEVQADVPAALDSLKG